MKAAFAVWNNRIAPVFDAAKKLCLVEAEAGCILSATYEPLIEELPVSRVLQLVRFNIDTLICGAISRSLYDMINAQGIRVIAFVAGDLQEMIRAWLVGDRDWVIFAMPGCSRQIRRRHRAAKGIFQEEFVMKERKRNRMGRGGGRGQGGANQGAGWMGGPYATGPVGYCVCPQCGRREPHKRGVPCTTMKCPNCGNAMARE
jgi:predicted Fe-Mo cluster-binding NifX family protein